MVGSTGPRVGKAGKPHFVDEVSALLERYAEISPEQIRRAVFNFGKSVEFFEDKKAEVEAARRALEAKEAELARREAVISDAKAALAELGAELAEIHQRFVRESPDLKEVTAALDREERLVPRLVEAG